MSHHHTWLSDHHCVYTTDFCSHPGDGARKLWIIWHHKQSLFFLLKAGLAHYECAALIIATNPVVCPQLQLEKSKGEILGVVIVESGWGSILPTVILANMMNGGPAARSGKLSIGDQIMSINNTSLVGLPLATCQGIIKVERRWQCVCGWGNVTENGVVFYVCVFFFV